jgi:predicted RNA-binding Zn-ribbon protein involved in translation (DUF1610 family)
MNPGEYSKNIKIKLDKQSGQLCFFDPTHPLARKNGMVTLGRHVLSVRLGRWLEPGEYALFMDGNPQNVDPENLQLTTLAEMVSHVRNRQVELVCPYCGEVFHVSKSHKDRRVHCKAVCRHLHSRKFEVDRDELETYVWQMPTTEVARQFGVSDKAIEKRCKLLGVNKPPRGYWAKLAAEESKQRGCGSDPQDEQE